MNCPVCDGVLSYSGIPDLFDCKTCEVRWVQETDADSGFTYFESESKGSGLTRKDLVLLSAGAVIGVFSGVIGEVLAELVLDRIRKTPELETTETAE